MLKPFQIIWELIEFGLQALFLYILAIIIVIGVLVYGIISLENKAEKIVYKDRIVTKYVEKAPRSSNDSIQYGEKKIEEKVKGMPVERECTRVAGCRVMEDGTIEW